MAKKILGAIISPVTTLLGVNPLFPKKKPAAPALVATTTPAKKPTFSPVITPLGSSAPAPRNPLYPLGSGSTILSDKLGG